VPADYRSSILLPFLIMYFSPSFKFWSFTLLLVVICCSTQPGYSFSKYKKGYYFKGTEKVEGYISFSFDTYEHFFFKKELDQSRQKISVFDCDSFVYGDKKFLKIPSLTLKMGIWNKSAPLAFAELVIEGPVNLYKVYSRLGNAGGAGSSKITNVFLEKNNSKSYVFVSANSSKFKENLSGLFTERRDISQKISSGYYSLKDIEHLVSDYNTSNSKAIAK